MDTREVKVGDIVKMTQLCITDVDLTVGKNYTVTNVSAKGGVYILDDIGSENYLFADQYTLVTGGTEPAPAPEPTAPSQTQVGGSHYTSMAIQPMEYIMANGIPFAEGNVIKYVSRWRKKNGLQDLEKAAHALAIVIEKVKSGEYK